MTDIEGSTRRWEEHPEVMAAQLERHDQIVHGAIATAGGEVFKHTGDGAAAVFADPSAAVRAALDLQLAMVRELPTMLIRVAVHTGEAEPRDGDWFGMTPNRVNRLLDAGAGGHVLVSGDTASIASVPAPARLEDLGRHWLRDVSEEIRILRLDHPDLPSATRPLRALEGLATNLPAPSSELIGRRREVDEVWAHLDGGGRCVTLTGPGGVGKTRLALEVAGRFVTERPDGSWWCDLASIDDPGSVSDAIGAALGISGEGDSPTARLVSGLRRKHCLVVLDNCEQVVDGVRAVVAEILARCPRAGLLATSRTALEVEGEVDVYLGPLAVDRPSAPGIRLFTDRARAVRSDFELRPRDVPVVMEICARLDGLPLAIELAAARIRSMSPADIAERLGDSLQWATGGGGHHRTLQSVVEWSYELCTPRQQLLFDRLAVFSGPFTLAAAEAVGVGDRIPRTVVADLVDGLVRQSMVVADVSSPTTRYELLETLRSFGAHRLRARGDAEEIRRAHATHHADWIVEVDARVHGEDEVAAGQEALLGLENLRSAFTWAMTNGETDLAFTIASRTAYLSYEMQRLETLGWCEQLLDVPGAPAHPLFPSVAGIAALGRGLLRDWGGGVELAGRAIASETPPGTPASIWPHLARVQIALWSGRMMELTAWVDEMVDVATRSGDQWAIARSLGLQAWSRSISGGSGAMAVAERALDAARRSGNPSVTSFVLWNQAQVLMHSGELERAIIAVQRAGEAAAGTQNRVAKGIAPQLEMALRDAVGDEIGALRCARDAMELLATDGRMTMLAGITMIQVVRELARAGRREVVAKALVVMSPEERQILATLETEVPELVEILRQGPEPEVPPSEAELARLVVSELDLLLHELEVTSDRSTIRSTPASDRS